MHWMLLDGNLVFYQKKMLPRNWWMKGVAETFVDEASNNILCNGRRTGVQSTLLLKWAAVHVSKRGLFWWRLRFVWEFYCVWLYHTQSTYSGYMPSRHVAEWFYPVIQNPDHINEKDRVLCGVKFLISFFTSWVINCKTFTEVEVVFVWKWRKPSI